MHTPSSVPHSLRDFLWLLLASFFTLGGGAGLWSWLTNRKKNRAETQEHVSRARNLDIQSSVSAGDLVLRYIDRLSNAQITIDDLHRELVDWKEKADEAESLRAANNLLENQLQEAKIQAKYWESECRRRR